MAAYASSTRHGAMKSRMDVSPVSWWMQFGCLTFRISLTGTDGLQRYLFYQSLSTPGVITSQKQNWLINMAIGIKSWILLMKQVLLDTSLKIPSNGWLLSKPRHLPEMSRGQKIYPMTCT